MAAVVRRNVGQKCRALNNSKVLAASNVARTSPRTVTEKTGASARRSLQKQKLVQPKVADTR